MELFRCPAKAMVEAAPAVVRALCFYPYVESGTWPAPGPLSHQSATFVEMVGFVRSTTNRLINDRIKREELTSRDNVPAGR